MVAVRNPVNDDVGYCIVLGRNDEFFGLEVVLGEEGLEGYTQLQAGMVNPNDIESMHMCVREGQGRPYYPLIYMMSDHDFYFILDMHLEDKNNHGAGMGNSFLKVVERQNVYPQRILFRKPQAGLALGYFSEKFDIKLERVDKLKAIDDARRKAVGFFKAK